jgi:peptidoglycan hydrolase-like protein with peptidoglycan-binding domain
MTAPAHADDPVVPPPTRCQRLGVIGGSITVGTSQSLAQELVEVGVTDFRIDAKVSRRIATRTGGVTTLKNMRRAGYDPDCLVISLGTNDIPYFNDPSVYRKLISALMDTVGPAPRVLWINVYRGRLRRHDDVFNQTLVEMTATYPNLLVADWFTLADEHRIWMNKDLIHTTSLGGRERSKWTAREVHERLNGGGPSSLPPSPCSVSVVPLQRTMRGPDVTCLEQRLRQLRWLSKRADTRFDPYTAKALGNWQRRHDLPATGVLDEVTQAALGLLPPGT